MPSNKYETVIGLEVHVQLLTNSKLFCGDSTSFGAAPNTHVSPISLAHPGTLPVMNRKAVEYAITLGMALGCDIEQHNYFARKNYFYPDLPKGYQVSQHTTPICKNGWVRIQASSGEGFIRLNRIHMEEDAGKSIHDLDENYTSIDLNRAGVPLLEIVTEPDLHSGEEAYAYLTEIRRLVRWLGICDGNMEEGSMRCDANISIRLAGEKKLGTRVEVKNLNSIRNVKKAIEWEADRLKQLTEEGKTIVQETRSFDAGTNTTFGLRSKEEADDYRYFPEPDLTPFYISDEMLAKLKNSMPALPEEMEKKFMSEYGLTPYDARQICEDKMTMHYVEETLQHTVHAKAVANWMMGPVKNYLNEHSQEEEHFPLSPEKLAELVNITEDGKINFTNASGKVLQYIIAHPESTALQASSALNLIQESDQSAIELWVEEVLLSMPEKVKEYHSGKKGLTGLFAGEVKKRSRGKADMQLVNKLLSERLNTHK